LLEAFDIAAHFRIYDVSTLADNETLFLHWLEYFRLKPHLAERLDIMLPSYFAALLNCHRVSDEHVNLPDAITPDQLRFDWMADPTPVPDAAEFAEQSKQQAAELAAMVCNFFG
jgi:hypothetical protein